MARRAGLYDALEKSLQRNAFEDPEEAEEFALRRQSAIAEARGETELVEPENLLLFAKENSVLTK